MTKKKSSGRRVTISLTEVVARWSDEMCEIRGFDNFSAYIADLIRRDKERQEEKDRVAACSSYRDRVVAAEEKPDPPLPDPKKKTSPLKPPREPHSN